MKLSVKVEYACRVLAHIARLHAKGELAHIETMAEEEAVPANYMVQILGELREGGLIHSRRGKQGGYTLARTPDQITLFDIVSLIDGALLEFGAGKQGRSGKRVAAAWNEVRDVMEAKARAITLDKLALHGGEPMYYI
ncbi:MAG TPA: Rrf2 family transcriptional regulator [Opitutaceae bacterium]|nr:Rrf2 family transcriptional regulator [Opitutaceae bacterium]